MAFILALGAVLGLSAVVSDALKFPCTGAAIPFEEDSELDGALVNCASGNCRLEKGSLNENAVKDYQNAIFVSVTTTSESFTLKKNRYVIFVNCSSAAVRVTLDGSSYTVFATGTAYFVNNTTTEDYVVTFSAVPPAPPGPSPPSGSGGT